MEYKVMLIKLSNNANAFRTSDMLGVTGQLPCPGEPFVVVGEPIVEGASFRVFGTSPVMSSKYLPDIGQTGSTDFKTLSGSQYRLIVLDTQEGSDNERE